MGREGLGECVRSPRVRVCETIQRVVTQHARKSLGSGLDYFGEEGVLRDMAAHLRAKGVGETEIA